MGSSAKKVVYICYEPLTAKVARDWYIDHLVSNGISVEYWDCSPIFYGKMEFADSLEKDFVIRIGDYRDLESRLRLNRHPDTVYIMLIVYEFKTFKVYRLLTRYGCKLYFIRWAVFPHKNRMVAKLTKLPSHPIKVLGRVCDKIFTDITKRIGSVRPFEKVFYAGSAARPGGRESLCGVPMNMCDYDNFITLKDAGGERPGSNHAVFLDVNLPFHPDLLLVNSEGVDPENYFNALNRFFDLIEKKYETAVVIAAHPSSKYEEKRFGGRKILKHVTPALVRDARLVISHHSASINFAVLNRKPIVLIYTSEMERLYGDSAMTIIRGTAEFLNATIYNIDTIVSEGQITLRDADEKRYEDYKYTFLTSRETEDVFSRDIFLREIAGQSLCR
jgi:hypothetical protein